MNISTTHETKADLKSQKSEKRRQQVFDAAEKCFREKGFHGSSIASISREAGMSPGHIYYHFADKEAIVEALTQRWQSEFSDILDSMEQREGTQDLISFFLEEAECIIDAHTDPHQSQLMLEISSESARNPRVAKILSDSDNQVKERVYNILRRQYQLEDAAKLKDMQDRLEFIGTLLMGFSLRAPLAPKMDKKAMVKILRELIQQLFANFKKDLKPSKRT